MAIYHTEILGEMDAINRMDVAQKIKNFCLAVSEQELAQIEREQIIEEVN